MVEKGEEFIELILYDPERNCSYVVNVTQEVANRAQTDIFFLQSLFDNVRRRDENREPTSSSRSVECNQVNDTSTNPAIETNIDLTRNPNTHMANNINERNNTRAAKNTNKESTNYIWKYNDTLLFIRSYQNHQEELDHPKKRNFFWENVANDLVSHGYNVNEEMCKRKFNNLKRTYKECKDSNKTGRGSTRFLFYDQMDEILGDRPCNSSKFTMGSLRKRTIESEEKEEKEIADDENDMNTVNTTSKKKKQRKRKNSCNDDSEDINLKKQKLELLKEKLRLEASRLDLQRETLQFLQERSKRKKSELNIQEKPNTDDEYKDEDKDETEN